jgi:hypothetical protein
VWLGQVWGMDLHVLLQLQLKWQQASLLLLLLLVVGLLVI